MSFLRNRRAAKPPALPSGRCPDQSGCSSCLAGRGAMQSTAQLAIPKVMKSNIENLWNYNLTLLWQIFSGGEFLGFPREDLRDS
jgi:hypothetical protein